MDAVVQRDPKAAGALTFAGIILEAQGKADAARQRYERALAIDPNAAVAANNLAWMTASTGGNLDVALQLAQTAKRGLPESAEVNDTLGWVYYKKEMYREAVNALQQSAEKAPSNPEYRYRLGMAYVKAGQWEKGKQALGEALKLKPDFPGADEAKKTLQSLGTS
jgi:tetratricopeptide (TPR) repeat protein